MVFVPRSSNLATELVKLFLLREGYRLWSESRKTIGSGNVMQLVVYHKAAVSIPNWFPKCALLITAQGEVGVYGYERNDELRYIGQVLLKHPDSLPQLSIWIDQVTQASLSSRASDCGSEDRSATLLPGKKEE